MPSALRVVLLTFSGINGTIIKKEAEMKQDSFLQYKRKIS